MPSSSTQSRSAWAFSPGAVRSALKKCEPIWSEAEERAARESEPEIPCAGITFEAFCDLIEIRLKEGGLRKFGPASWFREQHAFNLKRTGKDIVVKPRQIGFSTLELARDLWFAVTRKGVNVLVIGHDATQADQLFVTVRIMADSLRRLGLLPPTRHDNTRELVFSTLGSAIRVVEAGATEGSALNKGRSGTIHRLHATEVAFWRAAASTMDGVKNALPESAEEVYESTTNGVGGLFHQQVIAARDGRTKLELHFFAWWEHDEYRLDPPAGFDPAPRDVWEKKLRALGCDDAQVCWWRSKVDDPSVGLEKALQNFPIDIDTAFRSGGDAYLAAHVVDQLATHIDEPLRVLEIRHGARVLGDLRVYREPQPGRQYVVAADVAEGIGKDASTTVVLDKASADVCAVFWSDVIEPGELGEHVLPQIGRMYNTAVVAPERANHGHATLKGLKDAGYPRIYEAADKKLGWATTVATRPVLFDELAQGIRDGSLRTPDAAMVDECRTLIRDTDGKPRAKGKGKPPPEGCRDDLFVAWAIAIQARQYTPQEFQPARPGEIPNL